MISASHNPAGDNGIKFFGSDGFKLSDEQEYEIEAYLDQEGDDLPEPSADGLGTVDEYPEGVLKYAQYLQTTIPDDLSRHHSLLGCGKQGSFAGRQPSVRRLETDFYTMGANPDGININKGVSSTHPDVLGKFVVEKKADVGLAFDGDADRCIAVDENGRIIDGDRIMFICGKYLKERNKLNQNTIVSTVMSNAGFRLAVWKLKA